MTSKSVSVSEIDFDIAVGDIVGCRALISGYGARNWELIEADWYGGVDGIPDAESHSNGYDGKCWRHCGPARVVRITKNRVFFE